MNYAEFKPSPHLSRHVECFWQLEFTPAEASRPLEILCPDCSFDMLFASDVFALQFRGTGQREIVKTGAALVGQKTNSVHLRVNRPSCLFGIRLKPFALAGLLPVPLFQLTDRLIPLTELFAFTHSQAAMLRDLVTARSIENRLVLAERLSVDLLHSDLKVDELLRAQCNYIMDRKGNLAVGDLLKEFGVSKVTLHRHFLDKLGLPAKKVSRIWRLNYFLQLKKDTTEENFTQLCLEAGYYDQAHFIRDFRSFFRIAPGQAFREPSQLIRISQAVIDRRFGNHYDPVI